MATTTKTQITADEFFQMDLGEGLYELVRGEIVKVNPPEYWHGYLCGNVYTILREYGQRTGHGHAATNDSAVAVSEITVRGADICYYSEARWPRAQVGQGRPSVPPDLVVEVVSPNDRPGKVLEKVGEYLSAGVPMVWVLHAKQRNLTIYRGDDPTPMVLTEADIVDNLAELPGFRCPVAECFA